MAKQRVDLREWSSSVEEQWQLGSCTAQAVVGAYELMLRMHHPDQFVDLSRLFLYYNARKIEGYINEDVGTYVKTAVDAVRRYGLCKESLWPYDVNNFKTEPPWQCFLDARNRTISNSYELKSLQDVIEMLRENRPVVIGSNIYDEFYNITSSRSVLPMPKQTSHPLGSHAMCVVGFDNWQKMFIVRNSFGNDWGDDGHLMIPYEYAFENFSDMWAFDILVKAPVNK